MGEKEDAAASLNERIWEFEIHEELSIHATSFDALSVVRIRPHKLHDASNMPVVYRQYTLRPTRLCNGHFSDTFESLRCRKKSNLSRCETWKFESDPSFWVLILLQLYIWHLAATGITPWHHAYDSSEYERFYSAQVHSLDKIDSKIQLFVQLKFQKI